MDNTKYQITKTVRFKLELNPEYDASKLVPKSEEVGNLSNLITQLRSFLSDFKNIIFVDEEKKKWNYDLSVKYRWLKTYMKSDFFNRTYNSHSSVKQVSIKDLDYVRTYFNETWLIEFDDILNRLGEFVVDDAKTHLNTKKTIIADQLWKLSKRTTLEFAFTFLGALKSTNGEINKSILTLYYKQTEIETIIKNLQRIYAPNQSNGLFVLGASFNYYTINKRPKNYSVEINQTLSELKNKRISLTTFESRGGIDKQMANLVIKSPTYKYQKKNKDDEDKSYTIIKDEEYPYDELVAHLKNWRSFQFRMFNEAVQKLESKNLVTEEDIKSFYDNSDIILMQFNDKNDLKKYIELRQKRFELNNSESSSEEEIELIELKLDSYFIKKKLQKKDNTSLTKEEERLQRELNGNINKLKHYQNFCKFMMNIAGIQGRLKQKLIGLKKDEVNCEMLGYWSFIYEDKHKDKYLYLIDRHKMLDFRKAIKPYKKSSLDGTCYPKLYYINSLTLRSLRKLAFDSSSFKNKLSNKADFAFCNYKSEVDIKNKEILFYKSVLKYVSDNQYQFELDLSNYNLAELLDKDYESINDFEADLNKICYKRIVKVDNRIEQCIKDFSDGLYFKITSQNLRNPNTNIKPLTNIWEEYWKKDSYITRMNPEIKVLWRSERPHAVINHNPDIYAAYGYKMRNRYINEQFTLVSSFTLNADKQKYESAYKSLKCKIEEIDDFNKHLPPFVYAVGIDEGTKDLASITLVKNDNGIIIPQKINILRLKKEVFDFDNKDNNVQLKSGEIVNLYNFALPYINKKDGSVKQMHILVNPSYYLNKSLFNKIFPQYNFEEIKNLLFENDSVVSLDLTTSKVISGEIVEFGDFKTNQKLRILHAKRRIIESMQNIVQKDNEASYPSLSDDDYTIKIGADVIYKHAKVYDAIQPYLEVCEEIRKFYNDAKEEYQKRNYFFSMDSAANIDAINKTKNVIVGNMIGVLKKIYDRYPCYFAFEDFDPSSMESKKMHNEGDVYRLLERSIYSKFKTDGMIPAINEIIRIKDEVAQKSTIDENNLKTLKQVGIVKYVNKSTTSKMCPICGKGYDNKYYKVDKERQLYFCSKPDCRFVNFEPVLDSTISVSPNCPICGKVAYDDENNRLLDFERGIYYCKHCRYLHINGYTQELVDKYNHLYSLNTNDKIAGFNIAKLAFE